MDTISVQINVPRDVFGAMDVPEVEIGQRLQELVALELVREGRISTGKGAEMLGISKWAFVQRMARHGIEYFSESPEEMSEQLGALQRLLDARQAVIVVAHTPSAVKPLLNALRTSGIFMSDDLYQSACSLAGEWE